MSRFADRTRCPECRTALPPRPESCPSCRLPLTGPGPVRLFETLQLADDIVAGLRASVPPVAAPAAVGAGTRQGFGAGQGFGTGPAQPGRPNGFPGQPGSPFPRPAAPMPLGPPPSSFSVPQVLLGVGALCVVLAALFFMALTWDALGVGGRTVVLSLVTAGMAGGLVFSLVQKLSGAAETFTAVTGALLVFDLLGARAAIGWLDLSAAGAALACCVVVSAWAVAVMAAVRTRGRADLVAPQVLLALSGMVAPAALAELTGLMTATLFVCAAALVGASGAARRANFVVLQWGAFAAACLTTLNLLSWGTGRLFVSDGSLEAVWGQGRGLPVLAVALLLPALLWAVEPRLLSALSVLRSAVLGCSVTLAVGVVAFPVLDESLDSVTAVSLTVLAVGVVGAHLLHGVWWPLAGIPAAAAAPVPVAVTTYLLGRSAWNATTVADPFSAPVGVRVAADDTSLWVGWPLLAGVVLVAAVLGVVVRSGRARWLLVWPWLVGAVLVGGLSTWILSGVAVALVVCLLLVGAAALVARHFLTDRTVPAVMAAVLGAGGAVAALPSDWWVLVCAVVWSLGSGWLLTTRRPGIRSAAELVLPLALASTVAVAAHLAGLDLQWWALVTIAVLGLLFLAVPRPVLWGSTAVAAVVQTAASLAAVDGVEAANHAAVQFTLAGVLVVVQGLLRASHRRPALIVGGLLLVLATWCRLWALGVTDPEPYTLPSAVVLLVVGLLAMRRDPRVRTMTALLSGLSLAVVPSLLWVMALGPESSWRTLFLGAGLLTVLLLGSALRWAAPVLVGALGGAGYLFTLFVWFVPSELWFVIVWPLLGAAGLVLLVIGVTWEHQMRTFRSIRSRIAELR